MLLHFDRFSAARGEAVSTLKKLPDESIDAFVTDPPYGIELNLKTIPGRCTKIVGDGKAEARELWRRWVPEAYRVAKPDTAHVVFGTYKSPWMYETLAAHFDVKGCIVWDKGRMGMGYHLRQQWEMAYFVTKGRPIRRDAATRDIWRVMKLGRVRHPCEKPVELLRRAVRLVSVAGQLICDPFAGIFTSGVASMLEERRFIGVEIDKRFVKLGRDRLQAVQRDQDLTVRADLERGRVLIEEPRQ